ncbi:unnamed protein product [Protopolystoma xenopodis]|uniref:Dynactin subunit 6 n=1 Tax=Protopolystoma xenopodis TaxID=117903 RepID=A0A3S5CQI3_9PLAT|nr:unnamed protein product [Protopolystoma xenopodis]
MIFSLLFTGIHFLQISAVCHSLQVGDSNVFESKSFTGPQTIVSNGCTIGAMCSVTAAEQLPENTVVYGEEGMRRISCERPPVQTLQLEFLTRLLPNYHHLIRVTKPQNLNPIDGAASSQPGRISPS